jgi:hypothetical protein
MQDIEKFSADMSEDTGINPNFILKKLEFFKFVECLLKFSSEFVSYPCNAQN